MFISVIIPVYKNIPLLKLSLKSLQQQTYKKFEVIVVNDGSNEIKKIKRIIKIYRNSLNVKLINKKLNRGVSCALNIGIKNSRGKYISWLSSDDYFHSKKLEYQIKSIKNKNICITGFYCVDNKDRIFKTVKYTKLFFPLKDHILIRDNINFCTILLKKKLLMQVGLFDESLKHVQDYDMMFKLFQKNKPVILNKCLFYSRHHSGQSSVKYQNKAILEKEELYISKSELIKNLYYRSNILKKLIIIFFTRLRNIKKLNFLMTKLISKEKILIKFIFKMVYFFSEKYLYFKK